MALDGFLVYFSSLGSGVVSMLDTAIFSRACMRLKSKVKGMLANQKPIADRNPRIELHGELFLKVFAGRRDILALL